MSETPPELPPVSEPEAPMKSSSPADSKAAKQLLIAVFVIMVLCGLIGVVIAVRYYDQERRRGDQEIGFEYMILLEEQYRHEKILEDIIQHTQELVIAFEKNETEIKKIETELPQLKVMEVSMDQKLELHRMVRNLEEELERRRMERDNLRQALSDLEKDVDRHEQELIQREEEAKARIETLKHARWW